MFGAHYYVPALLAHLFHFRPSSFILFIVFISFSIAPGSLRGRERGRERGRDDARACRVGGGAGAAHPPGRSAAAAPLPPPGAPPLRPRCPSCVFLRLKGRSEARVVVYSTSFSRSTQCIQYNYIHCHCIVLLNILKVGRCKRWTLDAGRNVYVYVLYD